ncbi:MAG: glycosyltransferase [Actinobacteria bacterium]|nr:glycosyltransferase [Actinomycetota bacterium]
MTSTDPCISVVVPTYQRRHHVGLTVRALQAQDIEQPYEIIVVDDGTTDGTADILEDFARDDARVHVLRRPRNEGPGPARNAGWRAARGHVVAFTDDDCVPDRGWLAAVLAASDRGADVVMGRTCADPDGLAAAGPFSHWVEVDAPVPWFPTCNIAYRRSLLEELGGFDESFSAQLRLNFGDDTDLGWRALGRGAEARFAPDAVVVHEVTASDFGAWWRARFRRVGVPDVVARHPGLRAQLPWPWVYQRSHPPALLGALGMLAWSLRPRSWRRALLAAVALLPYVRFRVRGDGVLAVRGATRPTAVAGLFVGDVLEAAVTVRAAVRAHIVLI